MPTQDQLSDYAEVAIGVGLGLGPDDRLVINSPIDARDFTRLLVDVAYRKGAGNVDVIWTDEEVTRSRFASGPPAASEAITGFGHLLNATTESGDYLLYILAEDPDLLADQDPEKVARFRKLNSEFTKPLRDSTGSNKQNWAIVSVPTPSWARSVFPDRAEEDGMETLWQAILRTCRVDQPDPVEAWRAHVEHLAARAAFLTGRGYDSLRYSGPGTDLVVGLPARHQWVGGQTTSQAGVGFVPNLPTEEVFTSPDRERAEGTIAATKPLSLFGSLVEDFSFSVVGGRVVEARAGRGQAVLDQLLHVDEGSVRFGEVALVPESSVVAREGLIWRNMLFDENDACHIALGKGFPLALDGGTDMGQEELQSRGINESSVHVDFVVGSGDLNVYGDLGDGSEEMILERGEWAFGL